MKQTVVLATRPHAQNRSWIETLNHEGFSAYSMPLIEISTLNHDSDREKIKQYMLNLDHYNKLIFVSQNAVNHGFEWIDQYWPQFPVEVSCYGVGKKTASCLQENLEGSGIKVEFPEHVMNSEELLGLDSLQAVANEKILVFKGLGGRTKIQAQLEARQAKVDTCDLYRRLKIALDKDKLGYLLQTEKVVVPVFSGESLENFYEHANSISSNWHSISLVTPGARVTEIGKSYGFTSITSAENASEVAMLQAIRQVDLEFGKNSERFGK